MNWVMQIVFFVLMFTCVQAQNQNKQNPFSGIWKNSMESFSGTNLIFHGAGILSTYILINSGADYKLHNYFVRDGYSSFFDPAVGIGYILPAVLGGGLYLYGELGNKHEETAAGSAVLQAALISVAYSSLLKAFTGRPGPGPGLYEDAGASQEFLFGFMRGGIHYGWPSGHLCTNTAIVTSLMTFYRKNTAVKIAGALYLGYLFYGVIAHDNNTMHWFSDAVAGLLMGYTIGSTVGKNFLDNIKESKNSGTATVIKEGSGPVLFSFEKDHYACSIFPFVTSVYKGVNVKISF